MNGSVPSPCEAEILGAVENDELVLLYQPILNLRTGAVDAYEALVRWQPPGAALRLPGEFIPIAEKSDLICRLDCWVLDRAMRQAAEWHRPATDPPVVSVNVSGRHAGQARIRDDVTTALRRHGVQSTQLVLEITETFAVDRTRAAEHLQELRQLGVRISLDDFGSGHNSVEQLSLLPLDSVKIDRAYLDETTPAVHEKRSDLVRAAQSHGLAVIGEGVERPDQLAVLRALDVDSAQGFLIGRPVPPEELGFRSRSR